MTNNFNHKMCFLDCETTGVDRKLHNIFQLSGIITDFELNELERFNFKFKPMSLDHVESGAMTITGMTIEQLESLEMTGPEAYSELCQVLSRHCNKYDKKDKMHFVAYNVGFDSEFVREFFIKNGDNYFGSWFWVPGICVMQAAAWFTQRVRGALTNFKLGTLCKSAEIDWDDNTAHDAMYDIEKTIQLFKYIRDFTPSL